MLQIDDNMSRIMSTKAKLSEECPGATGNKLVLKTPKGTRDYASHQMLLRQGVLDKIIEVFKRHGGEAFDSPVFELKVGSSFTTYFHLVTH